MWLIPSLTGRKKGEEEEECVGCGVIRPKGRLSWGLSKHNDSSVMTSRWPKSRVLRLAQVIDSICIYSERTAALRSSSFSVGLRVHSLSIIGLWGSIDTQRGLITLFGLPDSSGELVEEVLFSCLSHQCRWAPARDPAASSDARCCSSPSHVGGKERLKVSSHTVFFLAWKFQFF